MVKQHKICKAFGHVILDTRPAYPSAVDENGQYDESKCLEAYHRFQDGLARLRNLKTRFESANASEHGPHHPGIVEMIVKKIESLVHPSPKP